MYKPYNPNPAGRVVGDCTVRAITKATGKPWEEVYAGMALDGFLLSDMPTANAVWGAYLRRNGYKRALIDDGCPDGYSSRGGSGGYSMRGRDWRGRYTRDEGRDQMVNELENLMGHLGNSEDRETLKRLMDHLRNS